MHNFHWLLPFDSFQFPTYHSSATVAAYHHPSLYNMTNFHHQVGMGASGVSSGGSQKEHFQWWPSPPPSLSPPTAQMTPPPQGSYFTPSSNPLQFHAPNQALLPPVSVQRKSRRCRCPNCLSGIQPINGKEPTNSVLFVFPHQFNSRGQSLKLTSTKMAFSSSLSPMKSQLCFWRE